MDLDLEIKEVLLQLIRETRQELPFALKTSHLKKFFGFGNEKLYELLGKEIPAKKIGGEWRIPRDPFLAWFYGVDLEKNLRMK